MPTILKYPLDPTGINISNLVVGEQHTLVNRPVRCVATTYGGYYANSMVITDLTNNKVLTSGQWYPGELYDVPTAMYGQPVYALVVITDPTVGSNISLQYQAVGGEFSTSEIALANLIDNLNLDNRHVTWPDILYKPTEYPPSEHLHDVGTVYGFEFVVHAIERVKNAIDFGSQFTNDQLYNYVDASIALANAQNTGSGNTNLATAKAYTDTETNRAKAAETGLNTSITSTALIANAAEPTANKSNAVTLGTSAILFPTQNAVKTYVDTATAGATTSLSALLNAEVTNRTNANALLVPKTTTVNGHALSSNVTVTATDVGLGNVNNTSDALKSIGGNAATVTTNANMTGMVTSIGNATTVVTNANLTGVVTSVGNATSIANSAITNVMLANTAVANLSGVNTGDQTTITGNAGTATKLQTARTITTSGDVNGTATSFDGSANIAIPLTLPNIATAGVYGSSTLTPTITLNSKGQVTAVTTNSITPAGIGAVSTTVLGVVNGVATLDASGRLTTAQIPAALVGAMQYQGTWNASTNVPALSSGVGVKGQYYKVSVAGSVTIDTVNQWSVGDIIAFDGTVWDKIDGLASEVTSVAGRIGAVTLTKTDVGLGNVDNTSDANKPVSTAQAIAIAAVQSELNTIETYAGLNADGTYTHPAGTTYLNSASSLMNADTLLDLAITNEVTNRTNAITAEATARTNAGYLTPYSSIYNYTGGNGTLNMSSVPFCRWLNIDCAVTSLNIIFRPGTFGLEFGIVTSFSISGVTCTTPSGGFDLIQGGLSNSSLSAFDSYSWIYVSTTQYGFDNSWVPTNAAFSAEVIRATNAEGTISTNLSTEVTNRTNAVNALLDVPSISSTGLTLALSHRGMSIDSSGSVTVPANATVAFGIGSIVTVTNTTATAFSIIAATNVTLRFAGTTLTGTRALAGYGWATMRKVATDTWYISGAGLS